MVSGRCLESVQKVYGMYLGGFWEMPERYLKGHWKVSGRCFKCVLSVSGKCLGGVGKVLEKCLKVVCMVSETYRITLGEPKGELQYGPAQPYLLQN